MLGQLRNVRLSDVTPSSLKHPAFSAHRVESLKVIMVALADVHPLSLEDWEIGFRKDTHPDREIAVWLHIAAVYGKFTAHLLPQEIDKKRAVYNVVFTCSISPREIAEMMPPPVTLTRRRVQEIVAHFFDEWKKEYGFGFLYPLGYATTT